MQIKKYNFIIWIALLLVCWVDFFIVFLYSLTTEQILMSFLPLVYIFAVTFSGAFKTWIDFSSPGFMIVNGMYFIKCVVYPFVNIISNTTYTTMNRDTLFAIILEIGEVVIIYLIFFLYNRFYPSRLENNKEYAAEQNHLDNGRFLVAWFFIFVVAIVLAFPSSLRAYHFFTVASLEIIYSGLSEASANGIAAWIIKLARYILVAYACGWFFCKYNKTGKTRYWLGALVLVGFTVMIVYGVSRSDFVIPGLCGYFLLVRLFPRKARLISFSLIGLLAMVFVTFSLMRFEEMNSLRELSESLQAYFCCEKNMAIAILAKRRYFHEIDFQTMLSDLLGNWAGIGRLFRQHYNISEYFNFVYHGHQLAVDQIVPTVGQSYMQFGGFGVYLYTAIMTVFCLTMDKKYRESDKIEFSYLYLYATVKCAITLMGNFKIFSATAFNVLLPMFLLFWFNQKFAVKRRKR